MKHFVNTETFRLFQLRL